MRVLLLFISVGGPLSDIGSEQPTVLADYTSCGITSLYAVCRLRGASISFDELRKQTGQPDADGMHSFGQLQAASRNVGLLCIGLQADRATLDNMPFPLIAQVNLKHNTGLAPHFLVLLAKLEDGYVIFEAPHAPYFIDEGDFAAMWTGRVLVFPHDEDSMSAIETVVFSSQSTRYLELVAWVMIPAACLSLIVTVLASRPAMSVIRGYLWRHRRIICIGLGTLCLVGIAVTAYCVGDHTSAEGPRCEIQQSIVDLGQLPQGATTYQLAIRNTGQGSLLLNSVDSSCSCAVVSFPGEIEEKEVAHLEVQVKVSSGPRQARLSILSNDKRGAQTVVLRWKGDAIPALNPYRIWQTARPEEETYSRVVQLVYPGGPGAITPIVTSATSNSPHVSIEKCRHAPISRRYDRFADVAGTVDEQSLRVDVRRPPNGRDVDAECKIQLTYGKENLTVILPIHVRFQRSGWSASNDHIVFSAATAKDMLGQERAVEIKTAKTLPTLAFGSMPRWLTGSIERQSPTCHMVHLRVAESPPPGFSDDTVTVNLPGESTSSIPISVRTFVPQE